MKEWGESGRKNSSLTHLCARLAFYGEAEGGDTLSRGSGSNPNCGTKAGGLLGPQFLCLSNKEATLAGGPQGLFFPDGRALGRGGGRQAGTTSCGLYHLARAATETRLGQRWSPQS